MACNIKPFIVLVLRQAINFEVGADPLIQAPSRLSFIPSSPCPPSFSSPEARVSNGFFSPPLCSRFPIVLFSFAVYFLSLLIFSFHLFAPFRHISISVRRQRKKHVDPHVFRGEKRKKQKVNEKKRLTSSSAPTRRPPQDTPPRTSHSPSSNHSSSSLSNHPTHPASSR